MNSTLIDHLFSRRFNAAAGIISTIEDNYLTTADAMKAEHTVVDSQFINKLFAHIIGLAPEQREIGHAFEIDPLNAKPLAQRDNLSTIDT